MVEQTIVEHRVDDKRVALAVVEQKIVEHRVDVDRSGSVVARLFVAKYRADADRFGSVVVEWELCTSAAGEEQSENRQNCRKAPNSSMLGEGYLFFGFFLKKRKGKRKLDDIKSKLVINRRCSASRHFWIWLCVPQVLA